MPIISVRNLSKIYRVHQRPQGLRAAVRALFKREYKEVRAVDGIDFDIAAGEMVGFLGPNGAGKTTTLKMLSGLVFPTSGAIEVLGFVPQERSNAYRRQFALLMGQRNQLWWDLPATDSFRLHREIYAIDPAAFERTLGELTELLGVGGLLNQPVRELSLGERMKMELIAALLHSPQVLFLDEPTIGLDVVAQAAIRRCLREYNRRAGVTILLTSHYMQDIEALCDRVLVINAGRLVHDGPLAGIVERFATSKIVTLRFREGCVPSRELLDGMVIAYTPPTVQLRLERAGIATCAAQLLSRFDIQDLSVEDPPIEEVIAQLFVAPQEKA